MEHQTSLFNFNVLCVPGGARIESTINYYPSKHSPEEFMKLLPKLACQKIQEKYPNLWIGLKETPLKSKEFKFIQKDGVIRTEVGNPLKTFPSLEKIAVCLKYHDCKKLYELLENGYTAEEAEMLKLIGDQSTEKDKLLELKPITIRGFREMKVENQKLLNRIEKLESGNLILKQEMTKIEYSHHQEMENMEASHNQEMKKMNQTIELLTSEVQALKLNLIKLDEKKTKMNHKLKEMFEIVNFE